MMVRRPKPMLSRDTVVSPATAVNPVTGRLPRPRDIRKRSRLIRASIRGLTPTRLSIVRSMATPIRSKAQAMVANRRRSIGGYGASHYPRRNSVAVAHDGTGGQQARSGWRTGPVHAH